MRQSQDEGAEIDVIKTILLREEYIERIKVNLDNQGSKFGKDQVAFDHVLGLIDLLRSTTVDACEAIQQWRKVEGRRSVPFIWKGMNYLLKIPIDLNFLDDQKVRKRFCRYNTSVLRSYCKFILSRSLYITTFHHLR